MSVENTDKQILRELGKELAEIAVLPVQQERIGDWTRLNRLEDDYVFSYKPNPAVFATDNYDPQVARAELEQVLEKTRGCVVEIIMKDISTVRYQPQRLWEWAKMAMEVTNVG